MHSLLLFAGAPLDERASCYIIVCPILTAVDQKARDEDQADYATMFRCTPSPLTAIVISELVRGTEPETTHGAVVSAQLLPLGLRPRRLMRKAHPLLIMSVLMSYCAEVLSFGSRKGDLFIHISCSHDMSYALSRSSSCRGPGVCLLMRASGSFSLTREQISVREQCSLADDRLSLHLDWIAWRVSDCDSDCRL